MASNNSRRIQTQPLNGVDSDNEEITELDLGTPRSSRGSSPRTRSFVSDSDQDLSPPDNEIGAITPRGQTRSYSRSSSPLSRRSPDIFSDQEAEESPRVRTPRARPRSRNPIAESDDDVEISPRVHPLTPPTPRAQVDRRGDASISYSRRDSDIMANIRRETELQAQINRIVEEAIYNPLDDTMTSVEEYYTDQAAEYKRLEILLNVAPSKNSNGSTAKWVKMFDKVDELLNFSLESNSYKQLNDYFRDDEYPETFIRYAYLKGRGLGVAKNVKDYLLLNSIDTKGKYRPQSGQEPDIKILDKLWKVVNNPYILKEEILRLEAMYGDISPELLHILNYYLNEDNASELNGVTENDHLGKSLTIVYQELHRLDRNAANKLLVIALNNGYLLLFNIFKNDYDGDLNSIISKLNDSELALLFASTNISPTIKSYEPKYQLIKAIRTYDEEAFLKYKYTLNSRNLAFHRVVWTEICMSFFNINQIQIHPETIVLMINSFLNVNVVPIDELTQILTDNWDGLAFLVNQEDDPKDNQIDPTCLLIFKTIYEHPNFDPYFDNLLIEKAVEIDASEYLELYLNDVDFSLERFKVYELYVNDDLNEKINPEEKERLDPKLGKIIKLNRLLWLTIIERAVRCFIRLHEESKYDDSPLRLEIVPNLLLYLTDKLDDMYEVLLTDWRIDPLKRVIRQFGGTLPEKYRASEIAKAKAFWDECFDYALEERQWWKIVYLIEGKHITGLNQEQIIKVNDSLYDQIYGFLNAESLAMRYGIFEELIKLRSNQVDFSDHALATFLFDKLDKKDSKILKLLGLESRDLKKITDLRDKLRHSNAIFLLADQNTLITRLINGLLSVYQGDIGFKDFAFVKFILYLRINLESVLDKIIARLLKYKHLVFLSGYIIPSLIELDEWNRIESLISLGVDPSLNKGQVVIFLAARTIGYDFRKKYEFRILDKWLNDPKVRKSIDLNKLYEIKATTTYYLDYIKYIYEKFPDSIGLYAYYRLIGLIFNENFTEALDGLEAGGIEPPEDIHLLKEALEYLIETTTEQLNATNQYHYYHPVALEELEIGNELIPILTKYINSIERKRVINQRRTRTPEEVEAATRFYD